MLACAAKSSGGSKVCSVFSSTSSSGPSAIGVSSPLRANPMWRLPSGEDSQPCRVRERLGDSYSQTIEFPNLDRLPGWAKDLLEEPVARLGLLDPRGAPRVLPVTFAVAGASLWSAVDRKPKRREGEELARV